MSKTESESEKEYQDLMNGITDSLNNIDEELPDDEIVDENNPVIDEDSDIIEGEEPDVISEEEPIDELDLYKEKYYLEKKKRKSVLSDRQKLEQENYQLKLALEETINSNTKLYSRDLDNNLEKAKSLKREALLGDDPDLLIKADEICQQFLHKVNEFESYIASRTPDVSDEKTSTPPIDDYEEQIKLTNAQDWLDERPELSPDSGSFNPKIYNELDVFIKKLDRELRKNGREDDILSEAYLDVLDEFIDSVKINRPKDGYTTSNVGGVRNNFSNSASGSVRVVLQDYEKDFAKAIGMSESKFLEQKILDLKNQQGGQSRYE